jgi:serine/threonine-protein kinase
MLDEQAVAQGRQGSQADILAGTPYRVLERIGAGGMGAVWEAEHRELGKRVVVKVLLPELAQDQRFVDRLLREARVMAQVASPYLVAVTDLGRTAAGVTYLVMERLQGHTLGRELKNRGALPVAEAVRWTKQLLLGLAAAHRAGIVHRDVKLDNIFLCDATDQEPRRLKLLDFGIAKVVDSGMDRVAQQLTAEGAVLGSPRWISPEQAMGKPVDARADVYAAGLVLYSLVVGRTPFAHLDAAAALGAAVTERPTLPSRCAPQRIPPALEDAILMAIEKDPDQRFQSADAFATALDAVLSDMTQPLPPGFEVAPFAGERRDSTAPTIQRKPEPFVRALPNAEGEEATAPLAAQRGRSIATFLGLSVASTMLVSALLVVLMRALGRW